MYLPPPHHVGIEIKEDELIDMTQLAYGDKWKGVYPSAGGSGKLLQY